MFYGIQIIVLKTHLSKIVKPSYFCKKLFINKKKIIITIICESTNLSVFKTGGFMKKSEFTGSAWDLFGWNVLSIIVGYVFILYPWYITRYSKWYYSNLIIDGRKVYFDYNKSYWGIFLWIFFILITLGIGTFYAIKKINEWQLSHVHFVDEERGESTFDGSAWGLFGYSILGQLSLLAFFIPYFFWYVGITKWITKHSVIDGKRLQFTYNGAYFGILGWGLFAILTFGLGSWYAQKRIIQWEASHTHLELK